MNSTLQGTMKHRWLNEFDPTETLLAEFIRPTTLPSEGMRLV
jgi:hypothetical protein